MGRGLRPGDAPVAGLARTLDGATMIFLELAFVTLWLGTILGAVWAYFSWGRPLWHSATGAMMPRRQWSIITMALVSYYQLSDSHVPFWVIIVCATAMAMGTAAGGWIIIKTLGVRLVQLRPIHGFAAETAAATVIEVASRIGLPLSTTHVISSTIMGVGASKRFSAVRWGVGGNIVLAWVLTIPACIALAWITCSLLHLIFG